MRELIKELLEAIRDSAAVDLLIIIPVTAFLIWIVYLITTTF
jgi:hypothetical protein